VVFVTQVFTRVAWEHCVNAPVGGDFSSVLNGADLVGCLFVNIFDTEVHGEVLMVGVGWSGIVGGRKAFGKAA